MAGGRRGAYGLDAPYVPFGMLAAALVMGGIGAAQLGARIAWEWWIPALWFALSAASYLFTTRSGKFAVWDELIGGMQLRGDERVLDVGCGRGAVLLAIAGKLAVGGNGRAVGLDLWSRADQSGNAESATRANAVAEGVTESVELNTGDMREMPFPDASFDVIVSSLAIHNLPTPADRAKAIDEIARVAKPGARIVLADIRHVDAYAARLRERGCTGVAARGLGWRFWFGGPYMATRVTTARRV